MIREDELVKRLTVYLQCQAHVPMTHEMQVYVVRVLAPKCLQIVNEQVAEDRRKRPALERQL